MTGLELIIPAFIAGLLTFLAPCTLPLVPGYLGFISGVSLQDLSDPAKAVRVRRKVFFNGLWYVLGFSLVFVIMGSLIGLIGGLAFAQSREILSRVGGFFVILFGFFMLSQAFPKVGLARIPGLGWLFSSRHAKLPGFIKPGNPLSSLIFGAAFAFGWTPCVGPVLGAIITLAATGANVGTGAFLLAVFSLGLAIPFLVLAGGIGYFAPRMGSIARFLPAISAIGGVFIVFLGILVLTNSLGIWISLFFRWFGFINYDSLLDYL